MIQSGVHAAARNWIFFPPSVCTDDILRPSISVRLCLLHRRPTLTYCRTYRQLYRQTIAIAITIVRNPVPYHSIAMSASNGCRECVRRTHLQTLFSPSFRRHRAPLESEPSSAARSSGRSRKRPAGALGFRIIRSWRSPSSESRRERAFNKLSRSSGGTW